MDLKVTLKDDSNNTYSLKTKAEAIEQDNQHLFVTLDEKEAWNKKPSVHCSKSIPDNSVGENGDLWVVIE